MPRRKDQAARRSELTQAARRVLAARGVEGMRLKDVAAEAGVSPQAVLYYYPDVDRLVEEAIQHTVERFAERRQAAIDGIDDPREALRATIRAGLPTGSDDVDLHILYAVAGYFKDHPVQGALIRSMTLRQVEVYRRLLELGAAGGVFDLTAPSLSIARNLVALEDAYGLYIIGGAPMVEEAYGLILSFAEIATRCRLSSA